jgi:hypothetical protein
MKYRAICPDESFGSNQGSGKIGAGRFHFRRDVFFPIRQQ